MDDRKAAYLEDAAKSENDWVRAHILLDEYVDYPEKPGPLAERAARMARDNLGERHSAHGIALLNLAICHEAREDDPGKAEEFFAQARGVLGEDHPEEAEALHLLGVFLLEKKEQPIRAVALLDRALQMRSRIALRERQPVDGDPPEAGIAIGTPEPAADVGVSRLRAIFRAAGIVIPADYDNACFRCGKPKRLRGDADGLCLDCHDECAYTGAGFDASVRSELKEGRWFIQSLGR